MYAKSYAEPRRSARSGRRIPRPFLKWVGGKSQLLGALRELVPEDIETYFEPFLGGGALFFDVQPSQAVIADLNPELVDCFTAVRDRLDRVIGHLEGHIYEKGHFYAVRDLEPDDLSLAERAARTIYLNRTGFNGLYRVNSKGRFNVPFGRYTNPLICDHENLQACSEALQGTDVVQGHFAEVLAKAKAGDFVYLDPPYVPVSRTSNFTHYVAGGFGPDDQNRLAQELVGLDSRGARFVLSNADTPEVRAMYLELGIPKLRIEQVLASRAVNSRSSGRGKVPELLVHNLG